MALDRGQSKGDDDDDPDLHVQQLLAVPRRHYIHILLDGSTGRYIGIYISILDGSTGIYIEGSTGSPSCTGR